VLAASTARRKEEDNRDFAAGNTLLEDSEVDARAINEVSLRIDSAEYENEDCDVITGSESDKSGIIGTYKSTFKRNFSLSEEDNIYIFRETKIRRRFCTAEESSKGEG
jgi:hypothetical protein